MRLSLLDWILVILFPLLSLLIGAIVSTRSGTSSESYFLSGRNVPWWLLGTSLVATTFSTDTPNLVTDMVRTGGVSKNWLWWSFLPTGMVTAFIYAKMWRRSGVVTDLEFYTLRYSSSIAVYLRSFRALYIGVFFNVVMMAAVSLAAIKIGAVMLGATPWQVLVVLGAATMVFSAAGGFLGVLIADLLLFVVAVIGAIGAAVFTLARPEIGGLAGLMSHPALAGKTSMLPDFSNWDVALAVFVVPLTIQWWSVWYPGSEPGGGGYVAQRMLAAKDAKHAVAAVLLFQLAHYAIRPWPWIFVALASLITFPDLQSLRAAFPDVAPSAIGHDLAYPAMLAFLPHGLLGLVVASLAAAYMSTIASQLNWGASYFVNDFWLCFVNRQASDREQVIVGRAATVGLMLAAGVLALFLSNALQAFQIILSIGAGTGLLFLLRWFWWRVNAYSEFAAMVISFVVAVGMAAYAPEEWSESRRLIISVAITTAGWVLVTLVTPPTDRKTLFDFVRLIDPAGPGWARVRAAAAVEGVSLPRTGTGSLARAIVCIPVATAGIYSTLFGAGFWFYGEHAPALVLGAVAVLASVFIWRSWDALFERGTAGRLQHATEPSP